MFERPAQPTASLEALDASEVSDGKSARVLIVEDDHSIRDALDLTFDMLGLQVAWAGTGEEAIELLQRLPAESLPSLLIVDGRLPDIHGLELVRRIQPLLRATEIFMFSAEASLNAEDLRRQGIHGLIRKPFDTERLLDLVSRHAEPVSADQGAPLLKTRSLLASVH